MSMLDPRSGADDENLTDAERRLLAAAANGTLLDLRADSAELDDPAQAMTWGPDRQIHAELLIELLTGTRRPGGKSPRAVKLRGARIIGSLNLEANTCICPLLLQDCNIEEPVNLDQATAPSDPLPRLPSARSDSCPAAHHWRPGAEYRGRRGRRDLPDRRPHRRPAQPERGQAV